MSFRFVASGETGFRDFDDKAAFEFLAGGILKLTEGEVTTYYSPAQWEYVTTFTDHKPGRYGGEKSAGPQVYAFPDDGPAPEEGPF